MKQVFILAHQEARRRAMEAVRLAPDGYAVRVTEPTRNLEQNALLHALLSEIAARKKWAGEFRDIETWKRLLTAAWLRVRGEGVTLLPAVDGQGFDVLYQHTSTLGKAEFSELVDYVQAWWADQPECVEEAA